MKKILLVDDEKDFLLIIGEVLNEAGFQVVTATNGIETFRSVREERPDLVILDIVLPDIDGETIYMKLKEDPATNAIPVIFVSGVFSKEEAKRERHFLHDKNFLVKPFNREELLSKVNETLGER